jgi:hypothetical protein
MDDHPFDAALSPAVCSNALRQAVRDDGDQQLLQQITRNYYVDNWLVSSTSSLNELILNHCIYPARDDLATIEIHIFGNVSEMGAFSYIRFVYTDGTADVRPLISKSRIASLKYMKIPCLELNIAVFAARLSVQVQQEYDVIFKSTTYWSDSTTVLSWINSRSYRFNNYVGNRIVEIFESSAAKQRKYVPSLVTPADDASRGLDLSEFSIQHRRFSGPDFLKTSVDRPTSPTLPSSDENDPEIGEVTLVRLIQRESDPVDKFTDKSRTFIIINTIGYLFAFFTTRGYLKID